MSESQSNTQCTQTMEVLQDGEELVFLYQLVEGKTDTSYACHIAAMMGLAPELVKRGAKVRVQNDYSFVLHF